MNNNFCVKPTISGAGVLSIDSEDLVLSDCYKIQVDALKRLTPFIFQKRKPKSNRS